jgi:hypothetical protein
VTAARILIPLAAVALAVFATSRLMSAIDPGSVGHPTGLARDTVRGLLGDSDAGYLKIDPGKAGRALRREAEREGSGKPPAAARETVSFFSRSGMRRLKSLLEAAAGRGGRASFLRLTADQAQVTVARAGRSTGEHLVIERGPSVRFRTPSPIIAPGSFSPREIDAAAPHRIGLTLARRSDATVADIDYMVFSLDPIEHRGGWEIFLARTGTHLHADEHGRGLVRR